MFTSPHVGMADGRVVTTIAGGGVGDGGPATSAGLFHPSGLALGAGGNLYIDDSNHCRVRKVSDGMIATVVGSGLCGYTGDGGPATVAALGYPSTGVVLDAGGNLYVADSGNCRVRKVDVGTGYITTAVGSGDCLYGGDGGPATSGGLTAGGLTLDAAGNLYVADTGNCRVRKVTTGTITTVAGNGTCGYAGDGGPAGNAALNQPRGLSVDAAGDLYIADSANCRVRKVSSGIITSIAGTGSCTYSGDAGPATSAALSLPSGVTNDGADVYIADSSNCRVRKVSGGTIVTVAGVGGCGFTGEGAPATSAALNHPSSVAVGAGGNLYIADTDNCRVRLVSGGVITTVAGDGQCGAYNGDGALAVNAGLNFPKQLVLSNSGDVYVADTGNCRVRKVSGGVITAFAGSSCGYGGDGGPATSSALSSPQGLELGANGDLYIADTNNCRVRKVSSGTITTFAGDGNCGYGGDGGLAANAGLNHPSAIALDAVGNVYIADTENCRVRQISGGLVSTVAGSGTCGFAGDGSAATNAELMAPYDVELDSAGNLYIADACRVRMVSGGTISTIAGSALCGYGGDGGPATSAQLNDPLSIELGAAGNLYIADTWNCRVREVSGGIITTVLGTGTCGYAGDGGAANLAALKHEYGVALDAAGNLYVADTENNRLRKVSASSPPASVGGLALRPEPLSSAPAPSRLMLTRYRWRALAMVIAITTSSVGWLLWRRRTSF